MEGKQPSEEGDIPLDEQESARKQEESRKELDEIPPHGTDPLHEGP